MRRTRVLAAVAVLVCSPAALAQTYPAKPVRIIVPFAPGGATDIVTRLLAQRLTEAWGQQIIVDNRAGAGGNIGGELAAKAAPDGYTLFMTSGSIVTANQHIYRRMPFNPERDLVAITNVASGPQALVVHPSLPTRSVKDLIALAKARPRDITLGSAGFGTQTHLAAENFMHAAGIELVHVPFKGEGPALVDLVSGQIQVVTPNLSAAIGFINNGRLRALAVTSRERSRQLPNVPAVAETLPGFENLGWFGLMAPAGTPKAAIDRVYADTARALAGAELGKRLAEIGMVPVGNTPEQFAGTIREESRRWSDVVKARKLQIQ